MLGQTRWHSKILAQAENWPQLLDINIQNFPGYSSAELDGRGNTAHTEFVFKDGGLHGEYIEYHDTKHRQISKRGYFVNNQPEGSFYEYDLQGNVLREFVFKHGRFVRKIVPLNDFFY